MKFERNRKGTIQCRTDYQILKHTFNLPTPLARKLRYWSWTHITTYLNNELQIPNLPTTRPPLQQRIQEQ